MININVFSEEKAWSKRLKNKKIFFRKVCKAFPKRYKFLSKKVSLTLILSNNKNINRIRQDGLTVLVVEQNVRMALLLADYGYVIKDGVINVEGDSKKLMYDESVKESYLGGTKANV